jgi:transcriptional regulator with XRE-family HTH domain
MEHPVEQRIELKVARVRKNLSQTAAGEAMGFTRAVVARAENGGQVRLQHARRMAQFYGRPFEELFPFEGETAA